MAKRRADQLLVDQGLAETRTKAQALILAGVVFAREQRIDKAGTTIDDATELRLAGRDHPWVSRGGLKLVHAIEHFAIDPSGVTALDLGASTGGFTDVLLTHGAAKVHAVDVGRGQLAWKLQQNPRVIIHDATNARFLTRADIPDPIELVTCDASFIGLETILPAPLALTAETARLVALIKPQFEAGAGRVGKGGVVRDPEIHREVCDRIAGWIAARPGWRVVGMTESPITGPAGNKEFLIYARKDG